MNRQKTHGAADRSSPSQTFDRLSRQQLQLYAQELRQALDKERELLRVLEEQNRALDQRIREISALNLLFRQYLVESINERGSR